MSTQIENTAVDCSCFHSHLPQIYREILKKFRRVVQTLAKVHFLFFCFLITETALLFSFTTRPAFIALGLGGLFFTIFTYFILVFYYQAKKPDQFIQVTEQFLKLCKQHIARPCGEDQLHLSIAESFLNLAEYLRDFDTHFYSTPPRIAPLLNRVASYCFWKDIFRFKELLFAAAIEEHLKQIRLTPTNLAVHASLANTYVSLSSLYQEMLEHKNTALFFAGQKADALLSPSFTRDKKTDTLFTNYSRAAHAALEEFQILNHFAPNDPWVHEQLAAGYKALSLLHDELKELEVLSTLRPQDEGILFRLGELYFRLGMNAKGLQIYATLIKRNASKAEELISFYGKTS